MCVYMCVCVCVCVLETLIKKLLEGFTINKNLFLLERRGWDHLYRVHFLFYPVLGIKKYRLDL